jgi:tRNA(Ile)-lysidine synthase
MRCEQPELSGTDHWLDRVALPRRLAVGFSGGADSTALLLALAGRGHEVVAWHVDHGWHAGSSAVADRLQARAAAWGIEFHRARVRGYAGRNREGAARKARFEQFFAWAAEQRINTLCLAQQRDDQAETVCMRLLQGAGPAGCAGMRRERLWQGLRIVRPLLHVSRAEIEFALQAAGVDWFEDASNLDTSLLRNRIRHELFAALRGKGVEPVELFGRWQLQAEKLAGRLDGLADSVVLDVRNGTAAVDWEDWRSSPAPVRAVLLQRMNAQVFGEGAVLGRRHILLAEQWLSNGGKRGIDLSRCRLFRSRQNLQLAPAAVSFPYGQG